MIKQRTQGKSLIVVEDDADDQYFLKTAFLETGFEPHVLWLDSSKDLFTYLDSIKDTKELPYAVLLDYNMPVMNGEQTLLELKRLKRYKDIMILIYSTNMSEKQIKNLLEEGASGCYIKSFSTSSIIDFAKFLQQKIAEAVFR
jgi:CheY-like chemotaxis protein